jgi:hypothetical protein
VGADWIPIEAAPLGFPALLRCAPPGCGAEAECASADDASVWVQAHAIAHGGTMNVQITERRAHAPT